MFSTRRDTDGEKQLSQPFKAPMKGDERDMLLRRTRLCSCTETKVGLCKVVTMVATLPPMKTLTTVSNCPSEARRHFLCFKRIDGSSRGSAAALRPTCLKLFSTSGLSLTQQLQFGSRHATWHTCSHRAPDETHTGYPIMDSVFVFVQVGNTNP